MKITVTAINPNDAFTGDKMTVSVKFHDDEAHYQQSAVVTVYVDKTVTDIDQIKTLAIENARNFLKRL